MVAPAICAGGIAAISVLKGASNATGHVIFTESERGVHVTGTVSVAAADNEPRPLVGGQSMLRGGAVSDCLALASLLPRSRTAAVTAQ